MQKIPECHPLRLRLGAMGRAAGDLASRLGPERFFLIASLTLSVVYISHVSCWVHHPHNKGRFLHAVHLALGVMGMPDRMPASFIETVGQIRTFRDASQVDNRYMAGNACRGWTEELREKYCRPYPADYRTPPFSRLAAISLRMGETVPFTSFVFAAHYPFVGYVFYAVGAWIGLMLRLPPIVIMGLAMGFNALMIAVLGFYTLRLLPVLRWPVCYLLLMPGSFILRALVMPDAVAVELCLLTLAIALHFTHFPRPLRRIEMAGMVLLAFLTGFVKFAYFLIPFIFVLIPVQCFGGRGVKGVIVSLATLFSIAAGTGWGLYATMAYYPWQLMPHSSLHHSPFWRNLDDTVFQPLAYLKGIFRTMSTRRWVVHTMNNMITGGGRWLQGGAPVILVALAPPALGTLVAAEGEGRVAPWWRAVSLMIFIGTLIVLCTVMYFHRAGDLSFDPGRSPLLVKGRYLLPAVPFLLLALHSAIPVPARARPHVRGTLMLAWASCLAWLHWKQLHVPAW